MAERWQEGCGASCLAAGGKDEERTSTPDWLLLLFFTRRPCVAVIREKKKLDA